MSKNKLVFIPLDYKFNPHRDWYLQLNKYFNCQYFVSTGLAIAFNPDVIFMQSGALTLAEMQNLRVNTNAIIVQFTGDCREEPLPEVLMGKGICDITALACGIAQKEMYERELGHRVAYLQHGVGGTAFRFPKTNFAERKIVFIGNAYSEFSGAIERNELCELLSGLYLNFEVIGSGYSEPKYNNTRTVPYVEVPTIYNESYISISANIFNDKEGYYSNRPLDIMAAGGCCLMRHSPNLERCFTDMEDCVFYRSNLEAVDKIQMLLQFPELRNRIAAKGQDKVFKNHTYEQRVLELINIIKS